MDEETRERSSKPRSEGNGRDPYGESKVEAGEIVAKTYPYALVHTIYCCISIADDVSM